MKTCAVIVVYHPEKETLNSLLGQLTTQVDSIIVVDNSSVPSTYLASNASIDYRYLSKNVGIASAQNIGISLALTDAYDYAILFDQDSTIERDFVKSLLTLMYSFNTTTDMPMAAIGPNILCGFSSELLPPSHSTVVSELDNLYLVRQIIASGMLLNLKYIDDIGLKDEQLFIDAVDHEWCWRAQQKKYVVGQAKAVIMRHKQGDKLKYLCGIKMKIGSPIRLYYQYRNLLLLVRRNYVPIYWKLRNLLLCVPKFLVNVSLFDNKKQRLHYVLKGLWDGVRCKAGAIDDNWK